VGALSLFLLKVCRIKDLCSITKKKNLLEEYFSVGYMQAQSREE